MTALFIVVPLALIVSALAVAAFVWSVKHGQLDDLSTPALRMLKDEVQPGASRHVAEERNATERVGPGTSSPHH